MLNEENKKREDKLQNSQESRAKEYNFYRQAQQDWQIVRILSSLVLSDLTLSSLSSHISIHICVTEGTVWYYMLTVCGCGRANHKFDQCVWLVYFFFELPPHTVIFQPDDANLPQDRRMIWENVTIVDFHPGSATGLLHWEWIACFNCEFGSCLTYWECAGCTVALIKATGLKKSANKILKWINSLPPLLCPILIKGFWGSGSCIHRILVRQMTMN